MGIKISKDHLHPSVIESVTSGIGDVSQLETDAKGNAVEAINELLEKRDRTKELEADLAEGKELIAEAVGEPLSEDDSFQDMSNDIKGLISQFKTNMMNSGVVVESGDKFKELIEKIQGLTEGEGNKGIKYAEGDCSGYAYLNNDYSNNMVINHNLGFIPQLFFVSMSITNADITKCNVIVSNLKEMRVNTRDTRFNISVNITNISEDNCTLKVARDVLMGDATTFTASKWFAIGVGEEDNTLRDSFASILQEEGVNVTEEDDMASLIAKVDEEFNDKNNEMSSLNTNITLLTNQVNSLTSELAGKVTPVGTAVAGDVLSGKTFINSSGQTVTGTMVNRGGAQTVTPGTSNKTLSAGYYSGNITVAGDADLIAANIVSGKNIFGVAGSAKSITGLSNVKKIDLEDLTINVSDSTTNIVSNKFTINPGFTPSLAIIVLVSKLDPSHTTILMSTKHYSYATSAQDYLYYATSPGSSTTRTSNIWINSVTSTTIDISIYAKKVSVGQFDISAILLG